MSNRFGRRRADGFFEYSDSLEELESSAIREDEAFLKQILALIGFVVGAITMYGLVGRHVPDWPKILRFTSILAGACLSGLIGASIAVLLRELFAIGFSLSVVSAFGWLLWNVLR